MISRVDDWLSEARYELDIAKLLLEKDAEEAVVIAEKTLIFVGGIVGKS